MLLEPHQIKEITQIKSIDEDMLSLLPKLAHLTHAMNPWVEQLPGIFSQLDLKPGQTILDVSCGTGRVSVPLAKPQRNSCPFEESGETRWTHPDWRRLPERGNLQHRLPRI